MKNFIQKIKEIFKKPSIQVSGAINPHKHWIILLWSFFIITILLIVFSLYMLYQIKNEQVFQVAPIVKVNSSLLKEQLLRDVIASFEAKAKKESSLKINPPIYKDPSI